MISRESFVIFTIVVQQETYVVTKTIQMKKNLKIEFEDVIIKISEMKLNIITENHPTPRHKFCLSVLTFKGKVIFNETIVISGIFEDFETKNGAESNIISVLKGMEETSFPRTKEDRKKFETFIAEFESELTKRLVYASQPVCQLF